MDEEWYNKVDVIIKWHYRVVFLKTSILMYSQDEQARSVKNVPEKAPKHKLYIRFLNR